MFYILDIAHSLKSSGALSDELYAAFQIAAEACMIHDMTGEGNWLHFQMNGNNHFIECGNHNETPLAILLIFADELAIWKRALSEAEAREQYLSAVAAMNIDYTDQTEPGGCANEWTINRTWTATDACGNESECLQVITVVDETDPVITCR